MINFVKRGSGKTVLVFLHGWGGTWRSWEPILNRIQSGFGSKYTLYALDLPGFGLSELSKPYGLSDYVTDVEGFLRRNEIRKPVLIGHSFGGQVAARLAMDHPEKIAGLVLVDSAVVRDNSRKLQANIALALWGQRMLLMTPLARYYPQIRGFYYRIRGWQDSDYFRIGEDGNMKKTAGNIFREDLSGKLRNIKAPTLVFWGEKDENPLTSISVGRRIHNDIKGSKMVVVPGAGHFSYLDDQEVFCRELTAFAELSLKK